MLPRALSGVWTALGTRLTHSPTVLNVSEKTLCSLLPGREDSIKEGVRDLKKTRVGQTDDSGDEEGLGEPEQESKEAKQVRLQKEREAKKMERLNAKLEKVNERRIKAEESRKRKLDAGADPALIKKQDRWVLEHGVSGAPQAHLQRNLRAPSSEQVQGSSGEVVDQSFCHLVFVESSAPSCLARRRTRTARRRPTRSSSGTRPSCSTQLVSRWTLSCRTDCALGICSSSPLQACAAEVHDHLFGTVSYLESRVEASFAVLLILECAL